MEARTSNGGYRSEPSCTRLRSLREIFVGYAHPIAMVGVLSVGEPTYLTSEQGKAVLAAEYTDTSARLAKFCPKARNLDFVAILKKRNLGAWRRGC